MESITVTPESRIEPKLRIENSSEQIEFSLGDSVRMHEHDSCFYTYIDRRFDGVLLFKTSAWMVPILVTLTEKQFEQKLKDGSITIVHNIRKKDVVVETFRSLERCLTL